MANDNNITATADELKDIELLKKHNKLIKLKVSLLDDNYQIIDNLIGTIKGYPSYDMDSESDIRRTCNITLVVRNKSQMQEDFEKTWNKRMVELSCGIYDDDSSYIAARKDENNYVWYKLGRMQMESGEVTYNASNQEIKLNLVDLMASISEERGSQIGTDTQFPTTEKGVIIKDMLEETIETFGVFKAHNICSFDDTLPYDLEFEKGIYPIEIFQKVLDLFPYYEMFYDTDGVFTIQKIPDKTSDPIDIDKDIINELLISEKRSSDFSDIKNTTEIWGRELEAKYAAISCTTSNNTYNLTIDQNFTALVNGETYSFIPDSDCVSGQYMDIQSLGRYQIYNENGDGTYTTITAGEMVSGMAYCVRYNQGKYILEGELQVRAIVQEINAAPSVAAQAAYKAENNCNNVQWVVNSESPYVCYENETTHIIEGEIKQVLTGGEYDSIYTTQLAYERCRYENYLKCRLQDKVELEMILIPWMDVNQKIRYTSPTSEEDGIWIVQSISCNFQNWTMSVNASRFYSTYPWDE